MDTPYLTVDLGKIEHNARTIVDLCTRAGIEVAGVTKGVCGHPAVAAAMLSGGVSSIADSRLINIRRLHQAGIADLLLLRLPSLTQSAAVPALTSVSLNSELVVLSALSQAAQAIGHRHDIVIMVELGDLREGVPPDEVLPFAREAVRLRGIRVKGLGANLACFAGVAPSEANMNQLVALAEAVEADCGIALEWLSAVNSSGLDLIASGRMPARINHARIGEAILLGRETTRRRPWPGAHLDAFVLHAEVLECRRKPSLPKGERAEDAFGATPDFTNQGERLRALLNVGREDVDPASLTSLDPGMVILGASSGYLLVDVTEAATPVTVGAELGFVPGYGALLRAMTSEYVEKRCA